MVKQKYPRGLFFVLFLTLPLLAACTQNTSQTNATSATSANQLQSNYDSPSWWNGKTCDQDHYPEAHLLTTWRGIQVCGPLPGANLGHVELFPGHGKSQYEFQCTELIARYLLAAYKLDSQQADGWQVVDKYTSLSGSPFHKVVNDGNTHMVPIEGDVLSYGPSDPGHTSIVTSSKVDSSGKGTIKVIEQNVAPSGTATLTMTNWKINHDTYHIGTVASWMTTRNIQTVLGASTQAASSTPSPTRTPVPPTLVVTPNPLNHVVNTCSDNNGEFACMFIIASPSDHQATINWHAVSPANPPNVNPSSGTLLPGQSTKVTLTLPDYLCGAVAPGTVLFTVYGGVSPISVTLGTC